MVRGLDFVDRRERGRRLQPVGAVSYNEGLLLAVHPTCLDQVGPGLHAVDLPTRRLASMLENIEVPVILVGVDQLGAFGPGRDVVGDMAVGEAGDQRFVRLGGLRRVVEVECGARRALRGEVKVGHPDLCDVRPGRLEGPRARGCPAALNATHGPWYGRGRRSARADEQGRRT